MRQIRSIFALAFLRSCQARCAVHRNSYGLEYGMFSLLMAVILPVMFVLFAVAMDLSQMCGIRDHLQRIADDTAHEALVRGLSVVDIDRNVRSRMAGVGSMAELSLVNATLAPDSAELAVLGQYHGVFSNFAENVLGRAGPAVPFQVRSRVRMLRSGLLVLVDRRVVDVTDVCGDQNLRSMGGFVERLLGSLQTIPSISTTVAVTPGDVDVVDVLAADGSDHVSRCRPRTSQSSLEVQEISGTIAPLDVWDSATGLSELVTRELFTQPFETRSVIAVIRSDVRAAGYASLAYQFLDESARATKMPVNVYVLVVDGGGTSSEAPQMGGLFGGVYREVGVSLSELRGDSLLGVVSRTVRERIVLEF